MYYYCFLYTNTYLQNKLFKRMYIFYIITNQICKVLKLMFNSDVLKLYKFFKKSNNKYSEQ